jgi:2-C-methyl-D-erythritol 2,4-cyclodiphosphate synthase
VRIEHGRGLLGHSDADAVLHAIADALLGAAGLPDIGELFPDTDPAFEGADSRALLRIVTQKIRAAGFAPVNIDCVVHADEPRIAPHKRRMSEAIAEVTGLTPDAIGVKATTYERAPGLGPADTIACTAVALLARSGTRQDGERDAREQG